MLTYASDQQGTHLDWIDGQKGNIEEKKLDGKFLITKITNPNLVKLVQRYK